VSYLGFDTLNYTGTGGPFATFDSEFKTRTISITCAGVEIF